MSAEHARCRQILQQLPLFLAASKSDLDQLAQMSRLVSLPSRHVLFKRGDACEGLHVIAYGRIKLSLISARGAEKPLHVLQAGDSVGDITMLLERAHYLHAQALEDCLLVQVSRSAVLQMIARDGRFALRMLASLSVRMHMVVDDMESYWLAPPAARLAVYLLRQLPPALEGDTPVRIELPMKKAMIAAQLGLQPETLSRHFKELSDAGLIGLQGRSILIHSPRQLGDYALLKGKDGAAAGVQAP